MDVLNSLLDIAEEKLSEEITQSAAQRKEM